MIEQTLKMAEINVKIVTFLPRVFPKYLVRRRLILYCYNPEI